MKGTLKGSVFSRQDRQGPHENATTMHKSFGPCQTTCWMPYRDPHACEMSYVLHACHHLTNWMHTAIVCDVARKNSMPC